MDSGIYLIKNILDDKVYIGSSINLKDRRYKHFWMLERGIHDNQHLQNSYNKFGEENFKFEILENCEYNLLVEKEVSVIDAIIGSQVKVKTPHGDIPITIQPGTEHGRQLRVVGKGIPDVNLGLGDLIVKVSLKIPKNVSQEEKAVLEKLKESNNFTA